MYELVLAQHKISSDELVGQVAPVPIVGAAGVAWGKDDGEGSPMPESYLGVYTESAVGSLGNHRVGLRRALSFQAKKNPPSIDMEA